MSLYLVPPGRRKANRWYLIRGSVGGRDIEVSTKTTDEAAARRLALELELRLLDDRVPEPGQKVSWGKAADLYRAFRQLDETSPDWKRIDRLKTVLGDKICGEIGQADIVDAADRLYPGRAAATKNREAVRMAAAVLHYAADNKWCQWQRVKVFREPAPVTRAVSVEAAIALIANVPDVPPTRMGNRETTEQDLARHRARVEKKRLLLVWLFRQGQRISDALRMRGEMIDLEARTITYRVGKGNNREVVKPLHDEVWELLVNDPPGAGPLFPWRTRSGVYKWLRPYTKALGLRFTPHMARHSVGRWLNQDRAGLKTIMDALDHLDVKSSTRYQSTDVEILRQASARLGKLKEKS